MNIILNFKTVTVIFLATLCLPHLLQGQQLRWQFKTGDTFDVSLNQTTNILSRVDKRSKKIDNSLTLFLTWKVESIDKDGNAKIEQTIKRVKLALNNPDLGVKGTTVVDTADPDNKKLLTKKGLASDLLNQVQPLVGLSFHVIMSDRGEMVDVIVPEATLVSLRAIPGSMRLRRLLTKSGLKDVFGQSTFTLPENEVGVDQSWTSRSNVQLPMGVFARSNDYTVTRIDDNAVEIALKTSISQDTSQPPAKDAPQIALVSFSGSGSLQWNNQAGHLKSSQIQNSMETDRTYREKNIISKVDSKIQLEITRIDTSNPDK